MTSRDEGEELDHSDRSADGPRRRSGRNGSPSRSPSFGAGRLLFWLIVGMLAYTVVRSVAPTQPGHTLSYTEFKAQVESGNVVEVAIRGRSVSGLLREPIAHTVDGDTASVTQFVTRVPELTDDELIPLLEANGTEIAALPPDDGGWTEILLWGLLPLLLFGGLMLVAARGMAGRARSLLAIGQSRAKRYEEDGSGITFDDVAGAAGAKAELSEIVTFLKEPGRFHRLGAEVPRGVLLVGPPGTGKTLLARAVAGEADVAFFTITGSDFMEMFVGVGAKRVRTLFEEAKAAAPSIVFIDELDSIGRRRGAGVGGGHDEREQTLNQLLSALDGFEPSENVIVMAATNRPDILDPALLRPGRFDRRITVGLPTTSERLEILRLHARTMILSPEIDLQPIAGGTPGFSGADLKNLLNEAALVAARQHADRIEEGHLGDARDRILLGLERPGLVLEDEEIRLLAYHEAGHALLGSVLPTADPVHKVTIIPRGRSMGSTHQIPDRERYVWRREELMDRLAMILGGRAAEEIACDTVTSGAEDDLRRATRLARSMVARWGMSDALGPLATAGDREVFLGEQLTRSRDFSEATAREVDDGVRALLEHAQERAHEALEGRRDTLERLATALMEKEEISGAEVGTIVGAHDVVEPSSPKTVDRGPGARGPSEPFVHTS